MEPQQMTGLITDLGLDNLPKDQKDDLTISLTEALNDRISERLLGMLTEAQKENWRNVVTGKQDDEADKYMAEKIPNMMDIMNDEYELYGKKL